MSNPLFETYWNKIKNKRLIDLTLPGTHDSASCAFTKDNPIANSEQFPNVSYPIVFKIIPGVFSSVLNSAKSQTLFIQEQLDLGIKSFDLRVGLQNNVLTLNHTFPCADENNNSLTLDAVLTTIQTYLKNHPFEFLILNIQPNGLKNGDDTSQIKTSIQDLCLKYFPVEMLINSNMFQNIYLEPLKNDNKRLVILGIDSPDKPVFVSNNLFRNSWINTSDSKVKTDGIIQQFNTMNVDKPLFTLDWTLTPQKSDITDIFKNTYSCGICGKGHKSLLELESNNGFDINGLHLFLDQNNFKKCVFQIISVDGANQEFIDLIKELWNVSF
jgi:hypothetical protein